MIGDVMPALRLCISVTLLHSTFHGRKGKEDSAPNEWPPSPLRLFQAMVAGSAARWACEGESTRAHLTAAAPVSAFYWLEALCEIAPPVILAPRVATGVPVPLYVPNNTADLVAAKWARGDTLATFDDRTRRVVRPMHVLGATTIHYLWLLDDRASSGAVDHVTALTAAARSIIALGWGIDMAVADARIIGEPEMEDLARQPLERWSPCPAPVLGSSLRLPCGGTFGDLVRRHAAFLKRLEGSVFRPPAPMRVFWNMTYLRGIKPVPRRIAAFALRRFDNPEAFRAFRFENAAKIAAMLRHVACQEAKRDWPFPESSGRYVAGHGERAKRRSATDDHPRFSYLAMPNVTGPHPDGMIRRVLIAEPFGGDGSHAEWAAMTLHGKPLVDEDTGKPVATLERIDDWTRDKVVPAFISGWHGANSREWITATPIVLPGFDGAKSTHRIREADAEGGERVIKVVKPDMTKARKLFSRACDQSGLPAGSVESFAFVGPPRWCGTAGQSFVPNYLRRWPLRHVRVIFREPVRGPIALGAGRHCGLGILVADG